MSTMRAWMLTGLVNLAVLAPSVGCAARAESPVAPSVPAVDRATVTGAITRALDDMHDAAAHADEARYFARFADDAVFLGTDATERWGVAAFRAYAHPRFAAGKAWSFHAVRRAITLADDAKLAWFDEDLVTAGLGPARGSGVVVLREGGWKVVQYNLALTVPNERFAEVHALLEHAAASPPGSFEERSRAAYDLATHAASRGDLAEAERALSGMVGEAESREGDSAAFWLHNQLTWVRWGQGDLFGAYTEVDAAKSALARAHLDPAKSARTGLHEKWDRAYLLRDAAVTAPVALRAASLAAADAARADYERAAAPLNDNDGRAVLAAFFAVRAHDAKGALAAAKRVDVEEDGDVQDLYVLALAYDLAGDRATGDAVRARIRGAKEYLMKPLILRQIEADAKDAHPKKDGAR